MLLGRSRSRWVRTAGLVGVGWALARGASALTALCSPAPWVVERYKYEALAETLPTEGAERWLDVGCGTGRSLVPDSCRVLGLDAATVRGDATRLPVGDRSHGVVTACRLLHDLPRERALETLSELERVCAPDAEGRREIFHIHTRDRPLAAGLDDVSVVEDVGLREEQSSEQRRLGPGRHRHRPTAQLLDARQFAPKDRPDRIEDRHRTLVEQRDGSDGPPRSERPAGDRRADHTDVGILTPGAGDRTRHRPRPFEKTFGVPAANGSRQGSPLVSGFPPLPGTAGRAPLDRGRTHECSVFERREGLAGPLAPEVGPDTDSEPRRWTEFVLAPQEKVREHACLYAAQPGGERVDERVVLRP